MTHKEHCHNPGDLDLSEETKDWKQYEREKMLLWNFLVKAESTLNASSESLEQALGPNEACLLELRTTLSELKDLLKAMTDLNYQLRRKVSRKRRQELRRDIAEYEECFSGVEKQLNVRLEYVEGTVAGWRDWYRRLHEFCDWLLHSHARLAQMENSHSAAGAVTSPETCVQEAQVLHDQVHKNRDTLTHLEKDLQSLMSGTTDSSVLGRSPLVSNLTVIRLKWEQLQTGSRDFSYKVLASSLEQFQKLPHWRSYRELKKRLVMWLGEAERHCGEQLTDGCITSAEEAVSLCQSHRALLHEREEYHTTLQNMRTEAGYLVEHPAMGEELDSVQDRWESLGSALQDRSDRVRTLCCRWLSPEDVSRMLAVTTDVEKLSGENFLITSDTSVETDSENNVVLDSDSLPGVSDQQLSLGLKNEVDSGLTKASSRGVTTAEHQQQQLQQQDATKTELRIEEMTPESGPPEVNHHHQRPRTPPKGVRAIFDALTSKQVSQNDASAVESVPKAKRKKLDMTRLPDLQVTVTSLQKCIIQSSRAIFPHEMTGRLSMLKSALSDYNRHDSEAQILQQELEDFLEENNNNVAEAQEQQPQGEACPPVTAASASQYLKLFRRLAKIGDMLEARVTLCQKWVGFTDSQDSARMQLQSLQDRMAKATEKTSGYAREAEEITSEMQKIKKTLESRRGEAISLGRWMLSTQLQIKNSVTHSLMQPVEQLQELEDICDTIELTAQRKLQLERLQKTDRVSQSEETSTVKLDENNMIPQKEEILSCGEPFLEDEEREIPPEKDILNLEQPCCEDKVIPSKKDILSSGQSNHGDEQILPQKVIARYEHSSHEDEDEESPAKEETLSSGQSCSEEDEDSSVNDEIHDQSDGELVFTLGGGISPTEAYIRFDQSGHKIVLASGEYEDILSSDEDANCTEC